MGDDCVRFVVERSAAILTQIPLIDTIVPISDRSARTEQGNSTPSYQRTCWSRFTAADSETNQLIGNILGTTHAVPSPSLTFSSKSGSQQFPSNERSAFLRRPVHWSSSTTVSSRSGSSAKNLGLYVPS